MNVQPTAVATPIVEPRDVPQLRTILLTDLVDSTAVVERLGDGAAAELFRAHDRLVLQLQNEWRGRLIDRSDGLLLLFERPIDGLGFALDYFRGLQQVGAPHGVELKARAGLHVGEVLSWRNSDEAVRVGAKPVEVEGLAKPMAGRLMTMARPGQLLMSAVAEPLAHRAARELGERGQHLVWKSHGRWRFKGVPQPQQIFEVGEPGVTPLRAPPSGPKAWRDVPLWRRPAALVAELALVAVVGFGIWFTTRPQPAIAFNERDWVVLADLRNLTDQPLLDDSLEQAFRISLEQSRHVNVLSDLKTRDTLARMQREPDTELDRAIASEIAIRDGARAVILPTVAEVGGRVRVSAEVIDPHSQTTVYSEYADGKSTVSALGSIDEVTAALRGKLGEALETVERDSAPLPRVTTGNLDALRAYALAQKAYAESQYAKAGALYERATEIDPKFALAHLGSVRVNMTIVSAAAALPHLNRALVLRDRLPAREGLYIDAWAAEFDSNYDAPGKWRLLAEMYPDYFAGPANYAGALLGENRFEEAIEFARRATTSQNPLRGIAYDYIGRSMLGMERYDSSVKMFDQALLLGTSSAARRRADVDATALRFEAAYEQLAKNSSDDPTKHYELITFAVDQGDWSRAERAVATAESDLSDDEMLLHHVFGLAGGVLAYLRGEEEESNEQLTAVAKGALAALAQVHATERFDEAYIALAAAYVAQRNGNESLAGRVLKGLASTPDVTQHPKVHELSEIVRANQDRFAGRGKAATVRLEALMTGAELFQAHVALMEAHMANKDREAALNEARWLAEHRGLAYIELPGAQSLQSLNVADTHLAKLHSAELLYHLDRRDEARREAEVFVKNWSMEQLPDHLRRRVSLILPASKQ